MHRVYRYRLYPTRAQDATMRQTLELLRELYNGALQERRDAYRKRGVRISANAQMRTFSDIRAERPEFGAVHTHLLKDAISRVDGAFRAFFRRCRSGDTPGFPRFKAKGRYKTFTFSDPKNRNGVRIVAGGNRVDFTGVGKVKCRFHRPIDGTVSRVTVTLDSDDRWYVCFGCADTAPRLLPPTDSSIGVDVGVLSFAALSNGQSVDNPRLFEGAQRKLASAQRRAKRRRPGSSRRRKAARLFAQQHCRVKRARLDFHHKIAADVVGRFGSIAVEDLNVKGLARMRLAKQVHDAGWAQFISILASKAESAGREFIKVDPRGTSQRCSGCGIDVPKKLSVRIHDCPDCGLVLDRDVNAARNIERLGQSLRGGVSSGRLEEPRSRKATCHEE